MRKKRNNDNSLKLLDVVALMKNLPDDKLSKGQVGTIVEKLDDNVYEVEFSDKNGQTIASLALKAEDLILLKFEMVAFTYLSEPFYANKS